MKSLPSLLAFTMVLVSFAAAPAAAWHATGRVICLENGAPLEGVTVTVRATSAGEPFTGSGATGADGRYDVWLPDSPRCYVATVALGPDEVAIEPASGSHSFCTTNSAPVVTRDFVISSPRCGSDQRAACWLTGGGNRFVSYVDIPLGENFEKHNWGGNVYPGCSSTAGDGGSWNHIAHVPRLHFQGRAIQVVRCGNVTGIPPGSTSPVTPYSFIEFAGTGSLRGVRGNQAEFPHVYFFARAEDRNEPGSSGVDDGAAKDRYYLHVYRDPANPYGSTLLLVDGDGDPATVDPLAILHGNLQLHVSSCEGEDPAGGSQTASVPGGSGAIAWLAAPEPNPAGTATRVRFGLASAAVASVSIHDVAGRAVRRLASGAMAAGDHALLWDLKDDEGAPVARGLYWVKVAIDGRSRSRPVAVIR